MSQQTLFDSDEPAAPAKPRLLCEPWLALKVHRATGGVIATETAMTWTARKAYGVIATYERAALKRATEEAEAEPVEPEPTPARAPDPMRGLIAAELADLLAEFERRECHEDEVFRFLGVALYVCTSQELVRVGKGLLNLLREGQ